MRSLRSRLIKNRDGVYRLYFISCVIADRLSQYDTGFGTLLSHGFRPDAALDLADVCFTQQVHAEARLSDSTTDRAGQGPGEQLLVEIERPFCLLSVHFQLAFEGGFVYTDSHARYLERTVKNRIPQQQIAVQSDITLFVRGAPVVVVCGTAVVRYSVRERSSDTDDKDGSILAYDLILPLLGRFARIEV